MLFLIGGGEGEMKMMSRVNYSSDASFFLLLLVSDVLSTSTKL